MSEDAYHSDNPVQPVGKRACDNVQSKLLFLNFGNMTIKRFSLLFLLPFILLACAEERTEPVADTVVDVEERARELGIRFDAPTPPTANYRRLIRSGNLVFLAGHGPDIPGGGGEQVRGVMGTDDLTLEEGQMAARYTGISLLNSLRSEIGDLNRVKRIVQVKGMVQTTPDYTQHSQVMNGFSDLMVELFGDRGRHARASVGMSSLPNNIAVEIDMVVEIEE